MSTLNPPDNIYLSIHTSKPNGLVTDFGIDRYYCDALKALNTRFYHKAIARQIMISNALNTFAWIFR